VGSRRFDSCRDIWRSKAGLGFHHSRRDKLAPWSTRLRGPRGHHAREAESLRNPNQLHSAWRRGHARTPTADSGAMILPAPGVSLLVGSRPCSLQLQRRGQMPAKRTSMRQVAYGAVCVCAVSLARGQSDDHAPSAPAAWTKWWPAAILRTTDAFRCREASAWPSRRYMECLQQTIRFCGREYPGGKHGH
jgi:hypothetical protein